MSEPSDIEKEQQAPVIREAATGPLLPKWLLLLFYAILGPFCIASAVYIGWSLMVQNRLTNAIVTLTGGLEAEASDADARQAVDALGRKPTHAFQYLIQELLQDEVKDPRMARALALRKAVDWGQSSVRRGLVSAILADMNDNGSVAADFALDQTAQGVLRDLIAERQADAEATYAQRLVTDVLVWIEDGHPGRSKGPEKRRLQSLYEHYAKKTLVGREAAALRDIAADWAAGSDPVRKAAAREFAGMLEGREAALAEDAATMCLQKADNWEHQYHRGMARIVQATIPMIEVILEEDRYLDHPHIYQYVSLFGSRFDEVRETVAKGLWMLRHKRYTIHFLSYFATKTSINPVMAVETVRLTKEEHERIMRRENTRRLREGVRLLGRIGRDYILHKDAYKLYDIANTDEFVRRFVIHALQDVADEELLSDLVAEQLALLREVDMAQPDGPTFFTKALDEHI